MAVGNTWSSYSQGIFILEKDTQIDFWIFSDSTIWGKDSRFDQLVEVKFLLRKSTNWKLFVKLLLFAPPFLLTLIFWYSPICTLCSNNYLYFPKHSMLIYDLMHFFTLLTLPGTSFPHTTQPIFPCPPGKLPENPRRCVWNFPDPPLPPLQSCYPLYYLQALNSLCRANYGVL